MTLTFASKVIPVIWNHRCYLHSMDNQCAKNEHPWSKNVIVVRVASGKTNFKYIRPWPLTPWSHLWFETYTIGNHVLNLNTSINNAEGVRFICKTDGQTNGTDYKISKFSQNCVYNWNGKVLKTKRLAIVGVEPTTFALLARRSNRLS